MSPSFPIRYRDLDTEGMGEGTQGESSFFFVNWKWHQWFKWLADKVFFAFVWFLFAVCFNCMLAIASIHRLYSYIYYLTFYLEMHINTCNNNVNKKILILSVKFCVAYLKLAMYFGERSTKNKLAFTLVCFSLLLGETKEIYRKFAISNTCHI